MQPSRTWSQAIPVLALTAWSLTGCYSYVPITDPTPSAVTGRVRVLLAARGTLAVRGSLGENVRAIEGPLVRATADSLYLNADQTTSLVGVQIAMLGTPVSVARADVLSVSEQRHSRRRSILTAAALVTGVAILISAITLASSGAPSDEPGPPPVTRIPH